MRERQELFCRQYLLSGSERQAAFAAGYTKEYGRKLIKQKEIGEYIEKMRSEKVCPEGKNGELLRKNTGKNELAGEKSRRFKIANAEEVLEFITSVMNGDNDEPLKERLRAAELMGRRYGLFKESGSDEKESKCLVIVGEENLT